MNQIVSGKGKPKRPARRGAKLPSTSGATSAVTTITAQPANRGFAGRISEIQNDRQAAELVFGAACPFGMQKGITVRHRHPVTRAIVMDYVDPERYRQLYDSGELEFQVSGLPRPENYPDPATL